MNNPGNNVERNLEIVRRVLGGESCNSVARDLGLSPPRVRDIVYTHCLRVNRPAHDRAQVYTVRRRSRPSCFAGLKELREMAGEFL